MSTARVRSMVARERRFELKLRTAELIGWDRKGTVRDDGFHSGFRRRVEEGMRELVESLRSINRMLDTIL